MHPGSLRPLLGTEILIELHSHFPPGLEEVFTVFKSNLPILEMRDPRPREEEHFAHRQKSHRQGQRWDWNSGLGSLLGREG